VTDGAANMVACGKTLKFRHAICIAHTLNLIVKKSLDMSPTICAIRTKARRVVGYFRSSTSEKVSFTRFVYITLCHVYKRFEYCLNQIVEI